MWPLGHHNRVIKLACTCASLTPAPRIQGSSSLCPSPFNCITRDIKRHLPYSNLFSVSFLLSFLHSSFLSPLYFLFTVHEMPCIVIPSFLILRLLITVHEMPCIVIPSFLITVHEMPCIVIPSF